MRRTLRSVLRDLLGRSSEEVVARLDAQLDVASRAVALAADACGDGEDVTDAIEALEAEGDQRRADVTTFLSTALVPPIDREDLFRLSRSIDDVLDNVRDFGRELRLYRPPRPKELLPVLTVVDNAVNELRDAVGALRGSPGEVVAAARQSSHAASQVRRGYDEAVGALFERPADTDLLRQRELLRRLDVIGLRLGEAANALADGGLKRVE